METLLGFFMGLLSIFGGGAADAELSSAVQMTDENSDSVELGITELSPRGHEGGYAMPASDDSTGCPDTYTALFLEDGTSECIHPNTACSVSATPSPVDVGDPVTLDYNVWGEGTSAYDSFSTYRCGQYDNESGDYSSCVALGSETCSPSSACEPQLTMDTTGLESETTYFVVVDGNSRWSTGRVDNGTYQTYSENWHCDTTLDTSPDAAASQANLTSQNLVVPALTEGQSVDITAEVHNNGAVGTGAGFDDIFEYSYSGNTGPWTQIGTLVAKQALAVDGTSGDTHSFTPPSSGDVWIQHCVDHGDAISELDESVADNCEVSGPINVNAAPVNGQCGPAAKNYTYEETFPDGATCSEGTASGVSDPPPGGSSTWTCNGSPAGSNASCTATREAEPTGGLSCTNPGIEADPAVIRSGDSTTLTWSNSTDGSECTITGGEFTSSPITSSSGGECSEETVTVSPTNTTTYTITCDHDPEGNPGTWTEDVAVHVIPIVEEN